METHIHTIIGRTANLSTRLGLLALVIIVGFGLMLRYQAFTHSEVPKYPHGDAAKYLTYAYNLRNFGIFGMHETSLIRADADKSLVREVLRPDALVTPGYPAFMSLFLGGDFTQDQRDRILFSQVILSTLTILLAYYAFSPANKLFGLGVAALTALSPHLVNMNLFFLTEPLFGFLLLAFAWLLSRVNQDTSLRFFLLTGIIFALATLTRPWIQGYLFILLAFLALSNLRIRVSRIVLIFVGTAILVTPWLVRNKIMLGAVADPTLSVASIHHGMYPDMMYDGQVDSLGYAYNADPMGPELGKSMDTTLAELKRRVQQDPADYLKWYSVGKAQSVLSWKMIAAADAVFVYHVKNSPYFELPRFYLSSYYMEQIHSLLMMLAIAGLIIVWLPRGLHRLTDESLFFLRAMSLLVIYFLVMHTIGAPYPRYSVPMRPILYAMSLYPLLFVARFLGLRFRRGASPR